MGGWVAGARGGERGEREEREREKEERERSSMCDARRSTQRRGREERVGWEGCGDVLREGFWGERQPMRHMPSFRDSRTLEEIRLSATCGRSGLERALLGDIGVGGEGKR